MVNKLRGILKVVRGEGPRLRRPPQGDARRTSPTLTGGKAIFKDLGIKLDVGQADRPGHGQEGHRSTPRTRRSSAAAGKKEAIDGRAEQIRREIETTDSDYDREKLQERLAKLAGGVAQINVGAATETEMKERKALIEDALHATRAAHRQKASSPAAAWPCSVRGKALDKLELDGDEALGAEIVAQRARHPAAARSPRTPASTAPWSSTASAR